MLQLISGNLLEADTEALVNTVNTVGYMGKGISLQFKRAYPSNFKAYEVACKSEELRPGKVFVFETGSMLNPKYIINFPTKRHWRSKSLIEDIDSGLDDLVQEIENRGIKSVAIPPLGCGLGGLSWSNVRTRIERAFSDLTHVHVLLFEPTATPDATTIAVSSERPKWTPARALLVLLMEQYTVLKYRLSLLEIQKLAFLLQEAGEPLKLQYKRARYGPYAHNLYKVLERIEGHFTEGFGATQRPDDEISVKSGVSEQAKEFLTGNTKSLSRLKKVNDLIVGFETPYGMELLASILWVTHHEDNPPKSDEEAIKRIRQWSKRKRELFNPVHIRIAWNRAKEHGWI